MYRFASFVVVFLLLAGTITAISAAIYKEPEPPVQLPDATEASEKPTEPPAREPTVPAPTLTQVDEHTENDAEYTPRVSPPDKENPCYYSTENIFYASDYGMPNCTCYAWGRAYELTGEKPELSPYDACTWYEYNAENGIYDYGEEPKQGAIACWAYADGGPGHVAVVEDVEDDTVLLSNSAYSGEEFYMDTVPADDPSAGRDNWIFQGYIYPGDKVR